MSCLHTLSVGLKPMVSLSLAVLPEQGSHLILAMGGLDHKIHIYCGDKSGKVCNFMFFIYSVFFFFFWVLFFLLYYVLTRHFSMCSSLKLVNSKVILIGSEV